MLSSITPPQSAIIYASIRSAVATNGAASVRTLINEFFNEVPVGQENSNWVSENVIENIVGIATATGEFVPVLRALPDNRYDYNIRRNPDFPRMEAQRMTDEEMRKVAERSATASEESARAATASANAGAASAEAGFRSAETARANITVSKWIVILSLLSLLATGVGTCVSLKALNQSSQQNDSTNALTRMSLDSSITQNARANLLTKKGLDQSRGDNEASNAISRLAVKQSEAANKRSLAISKAALDLDVRQANQTVTPYLQLENVCDSPLVVGSYRTIHYTIQNLGQAPAKILSARFSFGGAGNIPKGTDSSKLPILVADTTPINIYIIKESPVSLSFLTQQVLNSAKIDDIKWSGDEGYFAGEIIYKNLVDSTIRIYKFGIEIQESPTRTEFRMNDNYPAPKKPALK